MRTAFPPPHTTSRTPVGRSPVSGRILDVAEAAPGVRGPVPGLPTELRAGTKGGR